MRRSIYDDEVAMKFLVRIKRWRLSKGYTQKQCAQVLQISEGQMSNLESKPQVVSRTAYNDIAKRFGWPLYVAGRKLADWHPAEQKQDNRQMQIDFHSSTPAESSESWIPFLSAEVRSHVKILASVYEVTPNEILKNALQAYIKPRLELIESERQRESYRNEQKKRMPL